MRSGKRNRSGRAAILTDEQFSRLIRTGLLSDKHKLLFTLALYTGERIGALCRLEVENVYFDPGGRIAHDHILIPARIRKKTAGTAQTRQIPTSPTLAAKLSLYQPPTDGYLFPGRDPGSHLSPDSADQALRLGLDRCGLSGLGISTHSFRRTAITRLANSGISLRVIQEFTGHRSVRVLAGYIEVSQDQLAAAVAVI